MKDNRKILQVLVILTILFTVMGGSLAYWNWQSETTTAVTFTVGKGFSCSVDGGQNISSNEVSLAPASCTNELYAMKKEIKVMPNISTNDLAISMNLWLTVDHMDSGLYNSENFKYALTRSSDSCTSGVLSSGTFKGINDKEKVNILSERIYNKFGSSIETLYLYIWLDKEESSHDTMDQTFQFTLGGECHDSLGNGDDLAPESPYLDDAMIPVTIANNGNVTTVDATDPTWYDYENKQWANVVLVKEEGINNREYYLDNLSNNIPVEEEDILAYYVWIPRYKYRIPNSLCGNLDNPTKEEYPGCYIDYSMSDEDKSLLQEFIYNYYWYDSDGGNCSVSEEEIEDALKTAYFSDEVNHSDRCNGLLRKPLLDIVELHNGIDDGEKFYPGTDEVWYEKNKNLTLDGGIFSSNNMSYDPSSIDIAFETSVDAMVKGDAINTYYSHPGFWFDDNENGIVDDGETLSGIWVGKFETNTIYNDGDDYEPIGILPNVTSDVGIFWEGHALELSKKIHSKFGLNSTITNSHSPKNSEWTAIMYLMHSKYGLNSITEGCSSSLTGCGIYGTLGSYPQSTTGNISGVFDMSNKVIVMNVISTSGNSFNKYYDYYSCYYDDSYVCNIDTLCNGGKCYGHAFFETNYWYNRDFDTITPDSYTFYRSGGFNAYNVATPDIETKWRSVLINGFSN